MLDRGAIFKNSVGTEFRLLTVTGNGSARVAHVFNMGDPKAMPRQWKLVDLLEGFKDGEYTELPSRRMPVVAMSSLEALQRQDASAEVGKNRWAIIEPLINQPAILIRATRGPLVDARAAEFGCSPNTVITCLRLYWRGGMTRDALRGAFGNCGALKDAEAGEKIPVRGRRPAEDRYEKFAWTPELRKKVIATIKRILRKRNGKSQNFIYRGVLSAHFSVTDSDGKVHPRPLGERPTVAQIKHLILSAQSLEDRLRRKHGDDNFENNIEPKTGSARQYAGGIAQYYEIDSTIADVWICADSDPSIVIGKATLYLIIDVFSQLIVGFYLTLDKPSWSSALEAMMSLVEDKEQLCLRWGVKYRPEDWPAHGVWPAIFRADRGPEFISHSSDTIADNLETGLVNTPPRKSPYKGSVECSFGLVHVPLKELVGGYTPPKEFRQRQVQDRTKTATRTLKSVGREILERVIVQNKKVRKEIALPPSQVYRKMQPIPIEIWKYEYLNSAGALTKYDPDFLRFKLLPRLTMTVTPRGVYYKGLRWEPERKLKNQWLLPATQSTYKVEVTVDRRTVEFIYVHDFKDPTKWTTMYLTPNCSVYLGMSFADYEALLRKKRGLNEEADDHNLGLEIEHDRAVADRERSARTSTQAAINKAGGRSRTALGKDARQTQVSVSHMTTTVLNTTAVQNVNEFAPVPGTLSPESPESSRAINPFDEMDRSSSKTSPVPPPDKSKSQPTTANNNALLAILNMRKLK